MTATWALALVGVVGAVILNLAWLRSWKHPGYLEIPDRSNLLRVFALKLFVDLSTVAGLVALVHLIALASH